MPKLHIGVNDTPKELEKMWIGVNDTPKEIEKMWIGDDDGNPILIYDGGDIVDPPANFRVTSDTSTVVYFAWNTVTDASYYRIRYKQINSNLWTLFNGFFYSLSGNITGLSPNTAYNFQIAAVVDSVWTDWSSTVTETTDATQSKLATPTNVHVNSRTDTSIEFDWGAVTNATSYSYRYRESSDDTYITGTVTDSQVNITGLSSGTDYVFQVKATASGYADSNYTSVFTASTNPS